MSRCSRLYVMNRKAFSTAPHNELRSIWCPRAATSALHDVLTALRHCDSCRPVLVRRPYGRPRYSGVAEGGLKSQDEVRVMARRGGASPFVKWSVRPLLFASPTASKLQVPNTMKRSETIPHSYYDGPAPKRARM